MKKLGRDFYADAPNKKWATDVTEFKVPGENKKLYLSAILDLYDRYHCKTPPEVRNEALFSESPVGYPISRNKRIEKYKEKWCTQKNDRTFCAVVHQHFILDI